MFENLICLKCKKNVVKNQKICKNYTVAVDRKKKRVYLLFQSGFDIIFILIVVGSIIFLTPQDIRAKKLQERSDLGSEYFQEANTKYEDIEAYYGILQEYWKVKESGFDPAIVEQTAYVNEGVLNFYGYDGYSVYYQIIDLAKDGNPELIVSVMGDDEVPVIVDIYGVENGMPIRIIDNSAAVGYRVLYYLCQANRIKLVGSGGAFLSTVEYYVIPQNRVDMLLEEEYTYENVNGKDTYTYTDNKGNSIAIKKEEFENLYKKEDVNSEVVWIEISKYGDLQDKHQANTDSISVPETDNLDANQEYDSESGQEDITSTIHGSHVYELLDGEIKGLWEAVFLKDGTCEIDFTMSGGFNLDGTAADDDYFHYNVPYTVNWDEKMIYLNNALYEDTYVANFEKCSLDDVTILEN